MTLRDDALALLRSGVGSDASFHDGQWEAIHALVERRERLLVVQRTGWGKSVVYFLATKLLRQRGAGPTLIVSPLLALMRDQLRMAARLELIARRLDSSNTGEWEAIEAALYADGVDILFISPERLANDRFRRMLAAMPRGVGLLVIDEAHCISDWGHDFRPDYRRIVQIVRALPSSVPALATTATANDRVVADVQRQLGPGLDVLRGSLARKSLRLQTIRLDAQAERLAWLAENIARLPGSGIIYCLTVADTLLVADWLGHHGIDAPAYYGGLDNDSRVDLERRLLQNDVKALVATVALGMGFDKPDLGFVVHFQRPGSVVAYYQQIGRAGRSDHDAYAILLNGAEDDAIQDYFIESAFPTGAQQTAVVDALAQSDGLTVREVLRHVNMRQARVEQTLKLLELDGAAAWDPADRRYIRTLNPWAPDEARAQRVMAQRRAEVRTMQAFVATDRCLMEFIGRELDDPTAQPCGRCANCAGEAFPTTASVSGIERARSFLRSRDYEIEPRKQLPPGVYPERPRSIAADRRNERGRALALYGDAGWGALVRQGKYETERFDDALVEAVATLVERRWRPDPRPEWVTAVPSLRKPGLVADFAARLAHRLGIPYRETLRKVHETPEQKTMQNSAQQLLNIGEAIQALPTAVLPGPVLLVDDIVDSGWTLAVCGSRLRRAGSGLVHPFALSRMPPGGDAS